jgi:hypothetical protein
MSHISESYPLEKTSPAPPDEAAREAASAESLGFTPHDAAQEAAGEIAAALNCLRDVSDHLVDARVWLEGVKGVEGDELDDLIEALDAADDAFDELETALGDAESEAEAVKGED